MQGCIDTYVGIQIQNDISFIQELTQYEGFQRCRKFGHVVCSRHVVVTLLAHLQIGDG